MTTGQATDRSEPILPDPETMAQLRREPTAQALLNGITGRQVAMAAVAMALVAFGFWILWEFKFAFFALFGAVFLHVGMAPVVDWMEKRGIARRLGVTLVYGVLLLGVAGLLAVVVPMLSQQVGSFAAKVPDYYRSARNFMLQSDLDLLPRIARMLPPAWDIPGLQSVVMQSVEQAQAQAAVGDGAATPEASGLLPLLGRIGRGLFYAAAVFAMAFYWTMDRERIFFSLLMRVPLTRREDARQLIDELETKVGAFLRGQLILCAAVGGISLVAYLLIGLPYALALGALAFIFEAVPLVGPLLAAIPAVLVAATVGPDKLVWVLVLVAVIQVAENNILVPRVMDKAVGVNAIVSILAITAFSLLFGIPGALLAIPMAAMIQVLINRALFKSVDPVEVVAQNSVADAPRTGLTSLRSAASDLVEDVRKQQRSADVETSTVVDEIETHIEAVAESMVRLLAYIEESQAGPEPVTHGAMTPATAKEALR